MTRTRLLVGLLAAVVIAVGCSDDASKPDVTIDSTPPDVGPDIKTLPDYLVDSTTDAVDAALPDGPTLDAAPPQRPVYGWSAIVKGTVEGLDVAVDSAGNVYVVGTLDGSADFGGATVTSHGGDDIFVASYDSTGALRWVKAFGEANSNGADTPLSMVVDGTNVYLLADPSGPTDFGGGVVGDGLTDTVLVALSGQSGAYVWSKTFEYGISGVPLPRLALDASASRLYLAATLSSAIDLGGGSLSVTGDNDAALAAYDLSGAHKWSKVFSSGASTSLALTAVTAPQGAVVIAGRFVAPVSFGGSTIGTVGDMGLFAARFDSAGTHAWSKGWTMANPGVGPNIDRMATDGQGNLFLSGTLCGNGVNFPKVSLSFGGNAITADLCSIFVASLGGSGTHRWSHGWDDASLLPRAHVAADAAGNACLAGDFITQLDFGAGALTANGLSDVYVAGFDASGKHRGSASFGDTGVDSGNAVAAAPGGKFVVTGRMAGTMDLGGGQVTANGMYVLQLGFK